MDDWILIYCANPPQSWGGVGIMNPKTGIEWRTEGKPWGLRVTNLSLAADPGRVIDDKWVWDWFQSQLIRLGCSYYKDRDPMWKLTSVMTPGFPWALDRFGFTPKLKQLLLNMNVTTEDKLLGMKAKDFDWYYHKFTEHMIRQIRQKLAEKGLCLKGDKKPNK